MKKLNYLKTALAFLLFLTFSTFTTTTHEVKAATTKVLVTQHVYKSKKSLKYPQISGLKSKTVNAKINNALLNHIKNSYKTNASLKKESSNYFYKTSYKVKYSSSKTLSILFYDYAYYGGAHGTGTATSYNFSLSSGKQIKIKDVIKTKLNYSKVQKYAYNYLGAHEPYLYFVRSINDVPVNKDTQFYFTSNGIYLVFQEYEVASYADGNPAIKIPSSVYK